MMRKATLNFLLLGAVVASALAVVNARHQHRQIFVELESLKKQRDVLNVDWGKLQLEQSTWGAHGRIEKVAHKRLKMVTPNFDEIVIVRR